MSGRGKGDEPSSRDPGPVSAVESRQTTADYTTPMTDPSVPRTTGSGVQQELNTGMSGGMASSSIVAGNAHLEQGTTMTATMTVHSYKDADVEKIKERTTAKIQERTRGMVETEALNKIMNKLASVDWVTIKGQAGEGKTTAAFMALGKLQQSGREVFQVQTPDELSKVTKEFSKVSTAFPSPVILLDDILGTLEFDQTKWSKWRQVIEHILDEKEHTLYEKKSKKNVVTVILVSRNYALGNVSNDISEITRFFTKDKHVVFMSKSGERNKDEKIAILNAICESKDYDHELDDETVSRMCHVNVPHGFPHTCLLFVTLRKEGSEIDALTFMESPLEFLNQTVQKFLDDSTKQLLFKEMIKRDGKLPVSEIENLDNSYAVRKLADSLLDSYLRKEDDCYSFHNPSIYDSVALNLTKYFPSFVIKHCSVSFLHERLRFDPPRDTQQSTSNSESNLVVNIPRTKTYITDLAKRFAAEIENRKLVLSHNVLTDQLFIEELKCHVKLPPTSLWTLRDPKRDQSFFELLISNKAFQLLKYVISVEPELNALDSRGYTVLHYLCKYSPETDDVMRFLIDGGASVNTADGSWSPLHWSCICNKPQAVQCLLDHRADINSRDREGYTPLHEAVYSGSKDCVAVLVNAVADVNVQNTAGDTPLHTAAYRGSEDCVVLLVNAGAIIDTRNTQGQTPLHKAVYCISYGDIIYLPDISVCQTLISHGSVINKQDTEGNTPLHLLCHVDSHTEIDKYPYKPASVYRELYRRLVKLLVDHGAHREIKNNRGKLALHGWCKTLTD